MDADKEKSVYEVLSKIDLSDRVEKKGRFSYVSWSDAVAVLLENYPKSTWEVTKWSEGMPYCQTTTGAFVEVAVTVEGITRTQVHPVLDHSNKPIPSPNAFQINTSIQRCLAKAIALHGLSLYIFRGEDLPPSDLVGDEPMDTVDVDGDRVKKAAKYFMTTIDADIEEDVRTLKLKDFNAKLTNDEKIAVQALLKGKAEGSGRIYSTILKDYLKEK